MSALIRFHVRALVIATLLIGVFVLALGLTVLDGASETAASLAGFGIGTTGLALGYAISGRRLAKETR